MPARWSTGGTRSESIELYGSRRGQEATTWPTLEFPYTLLPGRGLRRSMRPAAWWANAGAVAGLAWACVRALGSFLRRRPRVVVIVGGYASFPAGVAAVLTRVPLVCMTTDAVPGAVNGLLGRFAAANAVAFAGTDLPRAHVTGTPVRPELATLDRTPEGRAASRVALGLPPDRQTVACAGGSLGALRVNRAVADLAEGRGPPAPTVRSTTSPAGVTTKRSPPTPPVDGPATDGTRGSGSARERRRRARAALPGGALRGPDARLLQRGRRVRRPGRRHDGGRAAGRGRPGHPGPAARRPARPSDAQRRRRWSALGAAVLVPDRECDGRRLAIELDALLADPARLRAMGEAARENGHPDAAARVAELVDAHAR